ncbi:hypothetical protein B0J14DRAFT_571431 [Halenospora varia]|nr:hypothetical protein B0J14DRAFT_571431 [Halenospora varia]
MSDVPQAFLQSPCQTSRQNIVAGEPWTDSLTSHHDQPAQQLSKLRSDDASKASQSQGIAPLDPNKPRHSSIGITSTNNSIGQATGLMRRPLPEQNPHTSLPVSNFPTLSSTPSNFAGTRASHARRLHALPLQSSITPLPEPSLPSPSTSPQRRILTIDNGTNSTLSSADAQLIHTFTMHAIVLLRLDNTSTRDYPASVIIWRTLQNFYQWYITETRSAEISVLRFKLLDDPSKLEREFILSKGDLQRFQTLKQYIWNCFWVVLNMNGGAARFRILITPLRLGDELASHSSQAPRWSNVNATASGLLASPLPASNLENIRVAADHQLPATAVTRRHYEPPSPYPPPFRSDNDDITTPQTRSIPAQINRVSHQPLESIKDPSPSHHNSMWMDVITGVFETSRTANDKKRLRDRATELIAGREDVELEEDETTGGRKRVYPDVCGAVVDKYSAKGIVAITVHGFPVQQVDTGQGLIGEPYAELAIGVGQTCLIHGSSTVLYYKPRKASVSDQAPRPSQPRVATQPRESSIHEVVKLP